MQSAGSKEQELVLVEHAFEYLSKDGRIICIKPNERYVLLKRTNEHWWQVCLDKTTTPFYIPAKYVKVLPLAATRFNGFQPYKDSLEDVQVAAPSNEYSYKFLPPCPQVSANFPLPPSDIQLTITGDAATSRNVESASQALSPKVPFISTSNTLPKVSMPKLAATNTLPSAMVPRVTSNNVQSKVVVPQIHVSNVLTKAPQIHSSYTLPPTNAQHVNATQPGSSTQSLPSDLPMVCGATGLDSIHTYPKEQPEDICTHAPMRTFHNSKKVIDPTKRTSFLFLTDAEPNILTTPPSGNLKQESSTPHQQPQKINNSSGLCGPHQVVTEPSNNTGSNGDSLSSQPIKEEEDSGPLYENLKPIQKESLRERASSLQHSSTSTLDDWETHTDSGSGQLFYYNSVTGVTTWDSPFDQPEDQGHSPTSLNSLSPLAEDSQWEKHFDEATRQYYFYNPVTGETSWDPPEEEMSFQEFSPMVPSYISVDRRPPTPEADYPDYSPEEVEKYPDADYDHDPPGLYEQIPLDKSPVDPNSGWFCQVNKEGNKYYSNSYNSEIWVQSKDRSGKTYFYTPDGSLSQWSLPRVGPARLHTPNDDNVFTKLQPNYPTFSPLKDTEGFGQRLKRANSEDFLDIGGNHYHHQTKNLEKAGVLHKAKISDNGKKLRKSWSSSWTVLEGGILTFFKDGKNLSSNSARQSHLSTPEYTVRLEGATLGWATKDKSSKKHVLELKTREGSEFLIHHDSETITTDWHESIKNSIARSIHFSADHTPDDEPEPFLEFGSTEKLGTKDEKKNSSMGSGSNSDSDRKVRAKLKKFLQRRPTIQSLRDKGYIKEQVFGCPLQQLCEREKQNVPEFVRKAIQAVEKRGLDIDGLYRVSGNLATIQKLRHKVDQEENINLEDGRWDDVHVITGALKLFFRELPEPLFPFSHFDMFIETIKLNDPAMKKKQFKELIQSLPPPNRETMQFLFRHLCNVIEFRESNRMSIQSVAIVFGPTLLRPSMEGANIAMFMVFQNQIVEQVLTQYKYIFNTS